MEIIINEIDVCKLSNNNPFVSKYWSDVKKKNNWNSKAYIINIGGYNYELLLLVKVIKFSFSLAYIPFAPQPIKHSNMNLALDNLEKISKLLSKKISKKVFVIRYDIPFNYETNDQFVIRNNIFKVNKYSVQPVNTIYINLDNNIDDIVQQYRKRAKRHIKKNMNHVDIKIWNNKNINELNIWYDIYKETGKNDGFTTRSYDYIFEVLKCENSKLVLAFVDDKIVGGNIVMFGECVSIYLFGGSLRNCGYSVSYTMQDFTIKLSHKMNIKYYDLFGVGGINSSHLNKLNLFKSSFGGTLINRSSTFDYVTFPIIYYIYKVIEFFRYLIYRG